jgi:hypothetical protein
MIIAPHSRLPRLSRMVRRSEGPLRGAYQVGRDTRVAHSRDFGVIPSPLLIVSALLSAPPGAALHAPFLDAFA